jgi:hypothetical protein
MRGPVLRYQKARPASQAFLLICLYVKCGYGVNPHRHITLPEVKAVNWY